EHPVTEEQMKTEYDKLKAANQKEEYKSRHILVKEEDKAKDIIARLGKGESFEDIAKAESEDPGSGANGGDLGWAGSDSYVQPFGEALGKTKKAVSTQSPVRSSCGWHLIQLEDTRTAEFPPLDQVKPQLEEVLRQQSLAKYQEELLKAAKVE